MKFPLIRNGLLAIALSLWTLQVTAQKFMWNKVLGGTDPDLIHYICQSHSKKHIFTISNTWNYSTRNVRTEIGTNILSSSKTMFIVLTKMDTSGEVVWSKKVLDGHGLTGRLISDPNDNLYYIGTLDHFDSIRFFPSSPAIYNPGFTTKVSFIVKLDRNGDFVWQRIFDNNSNISGLSVSEHAYTSDRIMLLLNLRGPAIIGDDSLPGPGIAWMAIDTNNVCLYARPITSFGGKNLNDVLIINTYRVEGNHIHALCRARDTFSIGQRSFPLRKPSGSNELHGFKITFDLYGNFVRMDMISKQASDPVFFSSWNSIGFLDSNRYCMLGLFQDTLNINGFPKVIRPNTIGFYLATYVNEKPCRLTCYDLDEYCSVHGMDVNNGSIYLRGYINGDSKLGGVKTSNRNGLNMYMKVDSLGNVVWMVRTGKENAGYNSAGFAFDESNAVYFATSFIGRTILGARTYHSKDSGMDLVVTKIHDNTITHSLSKKSFCAGDTFMAPYTTTGFFDTSNIFIAEISDENGLFDGGQREIGRLKYNSDSSITCVLPVNNMISSTAYRVRLTGTKPRTFSQYMQDSLSITVYSKDTADAGRDTSICYGTKTILETKGGSRWSWSPGHLVEDSTQRVTATVMLKQATRFRIIISDSMGCGPTDTAYKWVYPLSPLKITNRDTQVCTGKNMLFFLGTGGSKTRHPYQYTWLDSRGTVLSRSAILDFTDSAAQQLTLMLEDGCSEFGDTITLQVKRYDRLKLDMNKNVRFCNGNPLLKAMATGGTGNYHYSWHSANGNLISTSDSLIPNSSGLHSYRLKVDDNCSFQDSGTIDVQNHEPLLFSLPADTTICYGTTISLKPALKSGSKNGPYFFEMASLNHTDTISSESYSARLLHDGRVKVSAANRCEEIITDSIQYIVLQGLKIEGAESKDLCHGELLRLNVKTSGGRNPLLNWSDPANQEIKQQESIDTLLNPYSTRFRFIASDGCSENDTAFMKIQVLAPLKAVISSAPGCFKDTALLKAEASGGKSSEYKFLWNNAAGIIGTTASARHQTKNKAETVFFMLSDNCSEVYFDTLQLDPMAIAGAGVDKTIQCLKNNLFIFSNLTDSSGKNISSGHLSFGNKAEVNSIGDGKYKVRYGDTGKFMFKVVVRSNNDQCVDSAIQEVRVVPAPVLQLSWFRVNSTNEKSLWRFEAGSNQAVKSYTWHFGSSSQSGPLVYQEFAKKGPVIVRLVAEGVYDCSADTSFALNVQHKISFYLPDAISANGDGINETFGISGVQFIKKYHLEIYNRWGEKLYDSTDPNETWSPEQFSNNTYLYKLSILDIFNETHLLNGTFTVLK